MAAVYLAYDPRFRRKVAIKLVSVKLQDNRVFRERFEREAQLIARIEHPAIVPVYDFGEQDDQPYLVMRYMPGGALSDKIKAGPISLKDASHIISQIAPALDAVHAQGIVHRDLKPANILLDAFGNPAISDFGIAHFTQATTDLTGSAIIGTPAYMSPEQIRSDEDLDGRSDIYALGVILFEMLSGSGPFRASTPMSIAMKHLTDSVPSIQSLRPDLPIELEFILNKALAKSRDLRFSTASELALELQAVTARAQLEPPSVGQASLSEDTPTELYNDETNSQSSSSVVRPVSRSLPATRDLQSGPVEKVASKRSNKLLRILLLAAFGIFVFFVCGSIGVFGTWAGLTGVFAEKSPTAPATVLPTRTESAPPVILFADDFSDPNSGWPTGQNERGEFEYRLSGYRIFVTEQDAVLWVSTDRVHEDLSIAVDVKLVSSTNGYHGLLCRIQDEQNFYYFVVNQSGEYTIGKYKNAEFQSLLPEGWQQSNAIGLGDQNNRLQADCVGNTLRFYVNDTLLVEVVDSDFASGFSGMLAAALDAQGYEVLYDNFRITQSRP